jgi:First C2 domain of RPGR-interacting protein 1
VANLAEMQRKLARERELANAASRDAKAVKARLAVALRAARSARWGATPAMSDNGSAMHEDGDTRHEDLMARLEHALSVASELAVENRSLRAGIMPASAVEKEVHGETTSMLMTGAHTEVDGRPATSAGLSRAQVYGSGTASTSPAAAGARPGTRAGGGIRPRHGDHSFNDNAGAPPPLSPPSTPPGAAHRDNDAAVIQLQSALRESQDECAALRRQLRDLQDRHQQPAVPVDDGTTARLRSAVAAAQAREEALRQRSEADAAALAAFKANHSAVLRQLEATHARLAAERAAVARLTHQVDDLGGARGVGGLDGRSRVAELEAQLEALRSDKEALSSENKRLLETALAVPSRAAELRAVRAALADCARGKAQAEGALADSRRLLLAYGADATTGAPPAPGEDYRSVRSERDAARAVAARLRVELEAAQEALNLLRSTPPPSPTASPVNVAHSLPPVTYEQWQDALEERARLNEQVETLDAQLVAKDKQIALLDARLDDVLAEVAHLRAHAEAGHTAAAEHKARKEEAAAIEAADREREAEAEAARRLQQGRQVHAAGSSQAPSMPQSSSPHDRGRPDPFAVSTVDDLSPRPDAPPAAVDAVRSAEVDDGAGEADDIPGLGPDENILELHLLHLFIEKTALRGESNPSTFLTVDFFEHETQATPLAAGWSVDVNQTYEFVVAVDNLFIQFMELDCLRLDLHVAHGLDFRTVGSAAWPLRRVLDVPKGQRSRGAAESHDVQFRSTSGEVVATLGLHMRLVRPVTEALRLYRALPSFDFGIGRISEAKREARLSFQFGGPRSSTSSAAAAAGAIHEPALPESTGVFQTAIHV